MMNASPVQGDRFEAATQLNQIQIIRDLQMLNLSSDSDKILINEIVWEHQIGCW